jgi:hypothetical protein
MLPVAAAVAALLFSAGVLAMFAHMIRLCCHTVAP